MVVQARPLAFSLYYRSSGVIGDRTVWTGPRD